YNPLQYATDSTAQQLATMLGATVVKTAASEVPLNIPQQNMLDCGNGFIANAGLVANMFQMYGPAEASQMLTAQARLDAGAPIAVNNPSIAL
ncbi:MAG: hypothetical protein ACREH9_03785, partial [Pseudomonadota bacterium]